MRSLRVAGAVLVAGLVAGGLASSSLGAVAAAPEQQLAGRYSPVMALKVNDDLPCSTSGEQYSPTSVDIVLGNPQVQLVHAPTGQKSEVVKTAATESDLTGLGESYFLNQRGVPYRPGCTYARDSQRLTRGRQPVTYAHVARESGREGIALQFWFYYWFNHFNDLHESDWEMIQLAFDAATPEEALARGPTRIAYAQHGGGETADWDDGKLEKEATHPVVYVASGSHASQYESALYLGRGRQGAGLGCDDTRGKSYLVRPTPILVPTLPSATSEHAWLNYRGHWGQKAKGLSSGITGPSQKRQWQEPFTWMEDLRSSTPKMPVSEGAGATVTDFFCDTVASLAGAANYLGNRFWLLGLISLGLVAITVVPLRRTRWRPADPLPLRKERATGQLLRVAWIFYRQHALTLLSIALVIVLLSIGIARLLQLISQLTSTEIVFTPGDPGLDSLSGVFFASPAYPLVLALVGAPIVAVLRRIDAGERATPWAAFREVVPLLPRLLWVEVLGVLAMVGLALTLIGIPYAIKKAVDWTFAGQEIVFRRCKAREALSGSSRRVRGRWWAIAGVNVAIFFLGAMLAPLIAAFLIMFSDFPLWTINALGVALFGLALPYMVTTLTLLYLEPREQPEPSASTWRQRLRRRAEAEPAG
jgi:Vacuolar protein sorting-associated protein 62